MRQCIGHGDVDGEATGCGGGHGVKQEGIARSEYAKTQSLELRPVHDAIEKLEAAATPCTTLEWPTAQAQEPASRDAGDELAGTGDRDCAGAWTGGPAGGAPSRKGRVVASYRLRDCYFKW